MRDPTGARELEERVSGKHAGTWMALLVIVGASLGVAVYLYLNLRLVRTGRDEARAAVAAAEKKAAGAEAAAADARGALAQERGKLAEERKAFAKERAGLSRRLETVQSKAQEADALATKLQAAVNKADGALVKGEGDRLTLRLVESVLFRSAEADLTPQGQKVLAKVGKVLQEFPDKQVWVQGHTDDVPIASDKFPSNWELSAQRAVNVVHYLQSEAGVDPKRLAAVGFGQHRPVSRKVKAKNRRIEIVLFPEEIQVDKE